jgi:hypothetical protein
VSEVDRVKELERMIPEQMDRIAKMNSMASQSLQRTYINSLIAERNRLAAKIEHAAKPDATVGEGDGE